MYENNHTAVGWTVDELEVLRAADWSPPPISDDLLSTDKPITIGFTAEQYSTIKEAIELFCSRNGEEPNSANTLIKICKEYLA